MATNINYNTRQVDPLPGSPIRVKIETTGPNSWQVAVTNLDTNELIPVEHEMIIKIPNPHVSEPIIAEVKLIVSELVIDGILFNGIPAEDLGLASRTVVDA